MRPLICASLLLTSLFMSGCIDCGSNCDRDYRDCLDDPGSETIECDIGYDQCLNSCPPTGSAGSGASASSDGG